MTAGAAVAGVVVVWVTVRGVLAARSGWWELGVGRCCVVLLPGALALWWVDASAEMGAVTVAAVAAGDLVVAAAGVVAEVSGVAGRAVSVRERARAAEMAALADAVEVARLEAMWRAE